MILSAEQLHGLIASIHDRQIAIVEAVGVRGVSLNLTPGEQVQAEVIARLPTGQSLANIAGKTLSLPLPPEIKPGETIRLTFLAGEPRLTFALSQSERQGATTTVSDTGRWLAQITREPPPPVAPLTRPTPLLAAPPTDALQLAGKLQQALTRSGMFYESHLANWAAGERPLAAILQEPQGSLSQPAAFQKAAGEVPSPPSPISAPSTVPPAATPTVPQPTTTSSANPPLPASPVPSGTPADATPSETTPQTGKPDQPQSSAPIAATVTRPPPDSNAPLSATPVPGSSNAAVTTGQNMQTAAPQTNDPKPPGGIAPPSQQQGNSPGQATVATPDMRPPQEPLASAPQSARANAAPPVAAQAEEIFGGSSTRAASATTAHQTVEAPVPGTSLPTKEPADPRTIPLIREQLELLQNRTITWQGEGWPGQPLQWSVTEREADPDDPQQRAWHSAVDLQLPRLGDVKARLQLVGKTVQIVVSGKTAAAVQEMNTNSDTLRTQLEAHGLLLASLVISDE